MLLFFIFNNNNNNNNNKNNNNIHMVIIFLFCLNGECVIKDLLQLLDIIIGSGNI